MKNRRGGAKRRCQHKKHWMIPRELLLGPHRGFFFRVLTECCWYSVHIGILFLSRPIKKLWFIWVQPSWDPFCSRSDVSSLCWPRRTQWPQRRQTGWRFPYSGLWICLQKPALAASLQRGMVVKAAGCAGQGILILAWLETRDHFNPFALRASEDFPVDVDRPT